MTAPAPLHWDTLAKGVIKPEVFPLDFSKRDGFPYDSSGFKPLPEPPTTSQFNFSSLPTRAFELEKLEAYPLEMKTRVLPKPASTFPLEIPTRVAAANMDIRSWPQITKLNLIIRKMQLDSSGILWLATSDGIYSLDGSFLTSVLPGFVADGLLFDNDGNLWTTDKGNNSQSNLVKINFKNKTVERSIATFKLTNLPTLDLDNAGNIWVSGAPTSPPIVLNIRDMTYRMLDAKSGFRSSRYYEPLVDREGRIWYGSRNGIEIIDNKENRVYHITKDHGLLSDTIRARISDKDNNVWVTTPMGVDAISMGSGTIRHFKLYSKENIIPYQLLFDKTGQLWLANEEGPDILNIKENTFRHTGIVKDLTNELILDIIENNNGLIVFAGFSNNTGYPTLYSIGQFGKTVHPFGTLPIICTAEDSKGNIWVGTDKGVLVIDSSRNKYYELKVKDGLSNPIVQSVTEQQGKVVITTEDGYNIFDPDKNELRRINQKDGLVTDSVYSFMTDSDGNQWIVGNSAGIIKYDAANHLFMRVDMKGGLNGNIIIQILKIGGNKIVIIPQDSGPAIIDTRNNTIQTIKGNELLNSVLSKGTLFDGNGRLWVHGFSGNDKYGLFMMDFPHNTLTHFTTKEGLPDNSIYSVLEYKGEILAGAFQKIVKITPPELSSNKMWRTSILANSETLRKNTNSYLSDAITKGGDYFWGDDGLSIIYGIHADTTSANVVIKGISVMGTELSFISQELLKISDSAQEKKSESLEAAGYITRGEVRWDSIRGNNYLPVNLSLPHDQNVIQFHFVEAGIGRPDNIQYAYVLEGIDKKWTQTTKSETETYLNLPPSDYTFKVTSRWKNGKWNEPAVFSFTIRPPWYLTWWAYILYAMAAALVVSLIVRIQKARAIARERQHSEIREAKLKADAENERRRNIELISEMGKDITGSLSFRNIINTVYGHVNTLMDASIFGVGIFNKEKKQLEFPATKENGTTLPPYSYDVDDPNRPACWCFRNEKKFIVNDFEKEHKNYVSDISDTVAGNQASSIIYLPLIHKGNCMGVITAQSFKKDAYNDYHINILESLATYAAVALDNAETYRNLQATQVQLVQSEKMASLGELTAGIAHEIQNPLNFVNNFAEVNMDLIKEMHESIEKGDYDEVKELATNISGNEEKIIFHGKRADGIVKSMLQHSRSSSDTKVLTDINNLCDEYLRLAYHGLRAKDKSFNSGMETDFDESAGSINIVPQEIGRVILNLINNAFYACVERSRSAENDKSRHASAGSASNFYEPTVKVATKKYGNKILISVKDNGNGIPSTIKDKIFQPFFTTKPTGQGTGLGLSLSYDIVKAHGGDIKVESEEGEGSTFIVALPI
ncbi:MAG: ATP-binding protein [Chitinophagaceae bacterium]|nr:ATP-binding protein [Chitinophagaceae bacterium]